MPTETTEKPKHNYIFPSFVANAMSKIDQRTTYEAAMMSTTFIMVGLILSAVYAAIYLDVQLWFKITVVVNAFFGLMFMGVNLVNTYRQYLTYMEAKTMQEEMSKFNQIEVKGGFNYYG